MRTRTPNLRLTITFALIACAAIAAAPTPDKKPTEATLTKKPHNSPLATEGPKPAPITPPKPEETKSAIDRGIKFLLADQRPDGSWGSPERTKGLNIYAPPPGAHDAFRAATTSLVIMALIEAEPKLPEKERPEVNKAIDRATAWLEAHIAKLRRATGDALYNVWGHSYSIQAFVKLHERAKGDPARQAKLKELAQSQADMLARYSFIDGGWSYYDFLNETQIPADGAFSFTTATALIALKQGEAIGVTFPERLTKKAIASLLRQRMPDFEYIYGEYMIRDPRYFKYNRPGGSLGRSQACNLALRLYGDESVTNEVIKTWLNRLYARNGWLDMARKRPGDHKGPHESFLGIAGYFYYYGHWHAALCIDQLPAAERPYFQDQLARIILSHQDGDGSWWDFPLYDYHQQYGTAMAIMTLLRCEKSL
jgi:hypothetical protein